MRRSSGELTHGDFRTIKHLRGMYRSIRIKTGNEDGDVLFDITVYKESCIMQHVLYALEINQFRDMLKH